MKLSFSLKIILLVLASSLSSLSFAEVVWIDVRSQQEHAANHIDGDILIVHTDIVAQTMKLFPDRNTEIHLYCRSGRRAKEAMQALNAVGYTKVSNAGGIDETRKARGLPH
ncbi:rhodanese-like domain-containing protein [Psychromonas sp. MME2]|uniref:rhodanese-like domain-containing protein n=1 Tax=unclassified Psychromonas TaxID=2614957 RepID=UPI00339C7ED9